MQIQYPSHDWTGYELVDCGCQQKLERFGPYYLSRPEPKAIWDRSLTQQKWDSLVHTCFVPGAGFAKAGKEDSGTWDRRKRMVDRWFITYDGYSLGNSGMGLNLRLGLTSFKHVGVFPEQAPNWEFIYSRTSQLAKSAAMAGKPAPRILNLFAYTGAASVAASKAGGDVTHVDSVKQVVTWAKDNLERSGKDNVHWIIEDAMKFVRRQQRRGNVYQGIILDPPSYGHGPDGEKWKLDECLFEMLQCVGSLLAPKDSFMVLNLYSNGYSPLLGETAVREALKLGHTPSGRQGFELESGELCLKDSFGKVLPLSIFVRLSR